MRNVSLIHKSLILLTSLIALSALHGPTSTFADGASVTTVPHAVYFVPGTYSNSGATLSQGVDNATTSILISDRRLLGEGWVVKVDSEYMRIGQLIDGAQYSDPDTMVVTRGVNGSSPASHLNGRTIKAQTATLNIYANGITSPGLGGFTITMILPPEVQYVSLTWDSTWLGSTGRVPTCDGPFLISSGIWGVTCVTLEATPPPPTGSGIIGRVTLLPSQTLGTSSVSFAQSQLADIQGGILPATMPELLVTTLECPDANLDTWVDSGDQLEVAVNSGDTGVDSGATLVNSVYQSQTTMNISDQSKLVVGDTISIDDEQMTVTALHDGIPDTMNVTRAVNKTTAGVHVAGRHIFRATGGGRDHIKGYTDARDVNDDGYIDSGDLLIISSMIANQFNRCPG
jgi:hypothetical protein